jgi:hypothetical protein
MARKAKKSAAKSKKKSKAKRAAPSKNRAVARKSKPMKRKAAKRKPAKAKPAKRKPAKAKTAKRAKPAAKRKPDVKGEGNYTAARNFRKKQTAFVKRNEAKIPEMGKEAQMALDGPQGGELRAAEAETREHGAGMGEV